MTGLPRRPARARRWAVGLALLALVTAGCQDQAVDADGGGRASTVTAGSGTITDSPPVGGSPGTGTPTTGGGQVVQPGPVALGAKWDWGRYTEFEPYLKTLAGGRTYYEVVWCDVEASQGSPDWSTLDRIASRTQQVGVTLMLKLRVGRCWATEGEAEYTRGSKGKTESAMPRDLALYRQWVRTTVGRYAAKGVHAYAIENEINSKSFWAGTPEQFTTLAEAAAQEIRAADPKAAVVDAGLSSTTYGYGLADRLLREGRDAEAVAAYNRYYERRFGTRGDKITQVRDRAGLEQALASEQGARNLQYLRLMTELATRKVVDVRQIHFYEKYTAVPDLFTYLRATTPAGVPIEAWEVGSFYRGAEPETPERAQEMLKTTSLVLAEGARVAIWLPLAFDPGGRNSDEPRLGLLEPDGSVREVGRLFQSMVEAARGARPVEVSDARLTGVAFERPGGTTAFVWSDGEPVEVRLAAGESAEPTGPVTGGDAGSGGPASTAQVGPEPVRLSLKRTTRAFLEAQ